MQFEEASISRFPMKMPRRSTTVKDAIDYIEKNQKAK